MNSKKTTKEVKPESTFNRLTEVRKSYEVIKGDDKKRHIDCGDPIAAELRDLTLDEVYELAEGLGLEGLRAKYAKLNPGQQRMNLGNRLRAMAKHQNRQTLTKLEPVTREKEVKKAAPKAQAKAPKADKIERDAAGIPLPEATKGKKRGKKAA